MKLKTSFFDFAVLKKDLLRFSPVWALYLIGGLLVTQGGLAGDPGRSIASTLGYSVSSMGMVNLIFGALIAYLLFGDLFRGKMCNALHALPVRREAFFLSHVVAGLLMFLVPNLVLMLLLLPSLQGLWYAAFLWLGMMALQFLFFFGAAVLSVYCCGNTFAAALMYAIINAVALLLAAVAEIYYFPLLYGLRLTTAGYSKWIPMLEMVNSYDRLWRVNHAADCPERVHDHENGYWYDACRYVLQHDEKAWGYLALIAVVGVVFLAVSLLLYRRRKLECAGDFAAIRPVKVVFTTVGALAAGLLFQAFTGYDSRRWILLIAGIVVGFFVCQMLLARTIKVFGGKSWIRLGALLAALALTLGMTAVDVFGVTRKVPDADQVESVTIATHWLDDYDIKELGTQDMSLSRGAEPVYGYNRQGVITLTNAADIGEVLAIHQLLIEEGDPGEDYSYSKHQRITIHYQLKNGQTLTRFYNALRSGQAMAKMKQFTNRAEFVLGVATPEELVEGLEYLYFYQYSASHMDFQVNDETWRMKLAEALFADAEAGNLVQNQTGNWAYVEMRCRTEGGGILYRSFEIPSTATHVKQCLEEYQKWFSGNE